MLLTIDLRLTVLAGGMFVLLYIPFNAIMINIEKGIIKEHGTSVAGSDIWRGAPLSTGPDEQCFSTDNMLVLPHSSS